MVKVLEVDKEIKRKMKINTKKEDKDEKREEGHNEVKKGNAKMLNFYYSYCQKVFYNDLFLVENMLLCQNNILVHTIFSKNLNLRISTSEHNHL